MKEEKKRLPILKSVTSVAKKILSGQKAMVLPLPEIDNLISSAHTKQFVTIKGVLTPIFDSFLVRMK